MDESDKSNDTTQQIVNGSNLMIPMQPWNRDPMATFCFYVNRHKRMQIILLAHLKTLQFLHIYSHLPKKYPNTGYVLVSFYFFSCITLFVIQIEDPEKLKQFGNDQPISYPLSHLEQSLSPSL